ncbi:hypothetical protein AB1Y20_017104 [Prymnesium parvum]|uniref:ABC transporter domain-containing protein n=1 Tax=Prymnesium parvum TaxID=97485 RepID=A0AB34ICY7_PRYPA
MAASLQPSSFRQSVGSTFDFKDCYYTVQAKVAGSRRTKALIKGCSASVSAGQVLAIMGPSGAGKTTLLGLLSLEKLGGVPTGYVTLNGRAFDLRMYQRHASIVQQTDSHWGFLTAREHLTYAVALYQPTSRGAALTAAVDALLRETGLQECQHVIAGNLFVKGLSGGQRRRLSLAVALCKKPHVIFLDEPTSGLDAASAASIMAFLKETADRLHIAMVCTIHQPSASVFAGFDSVAFLTGGKMAYVGKASQLPQYLAAIGQPLPPNTNPADFMLDLINRDFTAGAQVDRMLEQWERQAPEVTLSRPSPLDDPRPPGCASRSAWLLAKHLKLMIRDPTLYLARMGVILFASIFFALIYLNTRSTTQEHVMPKVFLSLWLTIIPSGLAVTSLLASWIDFSIVRREVKDNMYHPLQYTLTIAIIQVPWMFAIGVFGLIPAGYGIGNFPFSRLAENIIVCGLTLWTTECLAQLCSLVSNPIVGILNFIQAYSACMVFSGLLLAPETVIWPLRAFFWVTPSKYSLSLFVYFVLSPTDEWDHAVVDMNAPGCDPITKAFCFTCPSAGVSCFGVTGEQVLRSLHAQFSVFDALDSQTRANYFLYILIVGGVFKLLYMAAHLFVCRQSEPPTPPAPTGNQVMPEGEEADGGAPAMALLPSGRQPGSASAKEVMSNDEACEFCFVGCTYTVKVPVKGSLLAKTDKVLLSNCSASVPAGSVLALLGPSGAGKTTLLNELTLVKGGGTPTGVITLGGHPFDLQTYKNYAAVVQQTDLHWPFLTAREHVHFATILYQPRMNMTTQLKWVDGLLDDVGLIDCQHVKAGNELFKGLSGGQRRRLSLAVALCKKPHVIFLDEPTSGLDAAAAASIMAFLKTTAAQMNVAVICTIHQPSTSVFAGFDSVAFLTGGKMAYVGKASQLPRYLESIHKPVPATSNPADFMLDLINRDFPSGEVDTMLSAWDQRAPSVALVPPSRRPAAAEFRTLLSKHVVVLARDPTMYIARVPIFLLLTVVLAVLYWNARQLEQNQVTPKVFFTMMLIEFPGIFCIVVCYALNFELKVVKREVKDGMYSPVTYWLVFTAIQIPMMFVLSLVNIIPALYPMIVEQWEGFPRMWLTFSVQLFALESLAATSAIHSNVLLGLMEFMETWTLFFLFNGITIPVDSVIWPFRIFCYVSPYRWAQPVIDYLAFINVPNYNGAAQCNVTTNTPVVPIENVTAIVCQSSILDSDGFGFFCPHLPAAGCVGRTGEQLLSGISKTFPSIFDIGESNVMGYIGICLAVAIVLKLVFLAKFVEECKQGECPKQSTRELVAAEDECNI